MLLDDPTQMCRFDCTVCPSGSPLVVTNIVRQSGWCNANQESCTHGSSYYAQCETCVKTIHSVATQHTKHGSCTTCSTGNAHQAYSWQENGKLPDGTLTHPVTLGLGYCHLGSTNREMGYKVTTGTGIYGEKCCRIILCWWSSDACMVCLRLWSTLVLS